jgi:DNA-binding HxlR family transcriptional regulator
MDEEPSRRQSAEQLAADAGLAAYVGGEPDDEENLTAKEVDEVAWELARPVFRSILDRIGDRWSIVVLLELRDRPQRFNEMHRNLPGISRRMLTFTLRTLERDGLLERTVYPTVPPKVEYAQTPLAGELRHTMEALADWSLRNRGPVLQARAAFDERETTEKDEQPQEPPKSAAAPQRLPAPRTRVPAGAGTRMASVNGGPPQAGRMAVGTPVSGGPPRGA